MNIRDIWNTITMISGGHSPVLSTVAGTEEGSDGWVVETRCEIVTGGQASQLAATGASIDDAISQLWLKITEMGPDSHLKCGNRAMRYGGSMIGFVPVTLPRKKRAKKATKKAEKK